MKQNTNYTTKLSFATNRPRESASLVQAKKSILPESEEPKLRKIRTEVYHLYYINISPLFFHFRQILYSKTKKTRKYSKTNQK
jgi:hypothetical protein